MHGFSARIFYVCGPRAKIGSPWPKMLPWGPDLGPGWAWELFGPKLGPKNMKSWRDDLSNGWIGGPQRGNGLYGTQEAFGQAHFPQTPPGKNVVQGLPHSLENKKNKKKQKTRKITRQQNSKKKKKHNLGPPGPPVVLPIGPWWSYSLFGHPQPCAM